MPKKPSAADTPASFEEAMTELAHLVAQMEGGALPLEASVTSYQRGATLVRFCSAQLDKVDGQVKVLEGEMLKPFENSNTGGAGADAAVEADE